MRFVAWGGPARTGSVLSQAWRGSHGDKRAKGPGACAPGPFRRRRTGVGQSVDDEDDPRSPRSHWIMM